MKYLSSDGLVLWIKLDIDKGEFCCSRWTAKGMEDASCHYLSSRFNSDLSGETLDERIRWISSVSSSILFARIVLWWRKATWLSDWIKPSTKMFSTSRWFDSFADIEESPRQSEGRRDLFLSRNGDIRFDDSLEKDARSVHGETTSQTNHLQRCSIDLTDHSIVIWLFSRFNRQIKTWFFLSLESNRKNARESQFLPRLTCLLDFSGIKGSETRISRN